MPAIIEIQNLQTTIPLNLARLKTKIRKVLKHKRVSCGHLSFVIIDNARMKVLNKKYLRHDYATDVLTFDWALQPSCKSLDGEVIISAQMAKRNAVKYGVDIQEEILLYMIHGVLHLLGYEDHSVFGIKKMRAEEKKLMSLVNLRVTALL